MKSQDLNSNRVLKFSSFDALGQHEFCGEKNALCWERTLEGDFEEIVRKLPRTGAITDVSGEDLLQLQLSFQGDLARKIILADLQLLSDFGAQPSLNLLENYQRDDEFNFISTDVYSYHVDRATVAASTFLCTYFGEASDILPNEQAIQSIKIPEVREKLKALHCGSDAEFENFLKENFYDLHYEALPDARPINLGKGNLWRLAIDHPGMQVLPCVHRAPQEKGEIRLMLIC